MQNRALYQDYLDRCLGRLAAIQTLAQETQWADVVRESQEVVELALKGLLRFAGVEVPRVHDVGDLVERHFQDAKQGLSLAEIGELRRISHQLRRDRELAFYGSEDLTPSEFYREEDAREASQAAARVVEVCRRVCGLPKQKARAPGSTKG